MNYYDFDNGYYYEYVKENGSGLYTFKKYVITESGDLEFIDTAYLINSEIKRLSPA